MKFSTRILALVALVLGLASAPTTFAQTLLTEDFTGTVSSATGGQGNWLFYNGACLTAGTSTVLTPPASSIPACTAVLNSYYVLQQDADQYLVGGYLGYLGSASQPSGPSNQVRDPGTSTGGNGALRFTNGGPFGHQERGAIVSTNAYSTNSGIQVTFKTVTYDGSGADGISFYLMDGCVPVTGANMPSDCAATAIYPVGATTVPGIGATGGSLAYTCTNETGNGPTVQNPTRTFDGLTGGYIGLGIDEYGNFLNPGDNTATGPGFQAGRIGLRGAGAISWPALNNAYGTNPNDPTKPFYPTWLGASCGTGSFDATTATCGVCKVIGPTSSTTGNVVTTTATTTVYTGGMCTNTTITTTKTTTDSGCGSSGYTLNAAIPICTKCSAGTYSTATDTANPNGVCFTPKKTNGSCNSGYTLDATLNLCIEQSNLATKTNFTTTTGTTTNAPGVVTITAPTSSTAIGSSASATQTAVQNTCSTGHLWNYATSPPTDAGPATLSTDTNSPNPKNTAGILDYAAIPGAAVTLQAITRSTTAARPRAARPRPSSTI